MLGYTYIACHVSSLRRPDRLWDPPRALFSGFWGRFVRRVKQPEREDELLPPSNAEVKHEVELYLSSPEGHLYLHLYSLFFGGVTTTAWVGAHLP